MLSMRRLLGAYDTRYVDAAALGDAHAEPVSFPAPPLSNIAQAAAITAAGRRRSMLRERRSRQP